MTTHRKTATTTTCRRCGLGAVLFAFALPVATADAARYDAGAFGNSANGIVEKRSFPVGAGYTLRFTDSQKARTRYRLCAFFKGSKRKCVSGRTGAKGKPSEKFSAAIFNPQTTGTLTWRYYVNSRRVTNAKVQITQGD